jgi:hypothetical protein
MPIILIPFIILGASRTHSHKVEADAARMQAETARMQYELNLAEYNERHHIKPAPTAIIVKGAWKQKH